MTHRVSRSPPVRRAVQESARAIPAVVVGIWAVSMTSPVALRMARAWLRAWVSTPMTNEYVCATMVLAVQALPTQRQRSGRWRPAPVWVGVTSGQHCDESRFYGADSLLIKSPRRARTASAASPR